MVLNNSQYNEIMREYNAKQMNTIHELDARTAEVYMAVPQYKTLSDRISSLSVDAAKAALRGENTLSGLNRRRYNLRCPDFSYRPVFLKITLLRITYVLNVKTQDISVMRNVPVSYRHPSICFTANPT